MLISNATMYLFPPTTSHTELHFFTFIRKHTCGVHAGHCCRLHSSAQAVSALHMPSEQDQPQVVPAVLFAALVGQQLCAAFSCDVITI